jgi:hypothetical protein
MDLGSRYFGPLSNISCTEDSVKVTNYNVASQVIYEWGTC